MRQTQRPTAIARSDNVLTLRSYPRYILYGGTLDADFRHCTVIMKYQIYIINTTKSLSDLDLDTYGA